MELPFAVESSSDGGRNMSSSHQSTTSSSSLVTAYSSEDTYLQSSNGYEPILTSTRGPATGSLPPPDHVTLQAHVPTPSSQPTNRPATNNSNSNTHSTTTGSRFSSVLSQFGVTVSNASNSNSNKARPPVEQLRKTETIDFMDTYVNVCETDADEVDIILAGGDPGIACQQQNANQEQGLRGDILTVLLSGPLHSANHNQEDDGGGGGGGETIVTKCEDANRATARAAQAKKDGNLQEALDAHTQAAKLFREAAIHIGEGNASMARSLLLLSQTQAKSALALKRVVKLRPNSLLPTKNNKSATGSSNNRSTTHKERLRATVRGVYDNRTEEDISDSAFLGRATSAYPSNHPAAAAEQRDGDASQSSFRHNDDSNSHNNNPVDEMMELERELRDMDMALELGNSIASLDARTQNRMKNSMVGDGSFMVVPPGSNSYMSSSSMWGGHQHGTGTPTRSTSNTPVNNHPVSGTAGVRARANRVQNILEASSTRPAPPQSSLPPPPQSQLSSAPPLRNNGLESSWWGNSSSASQVLTSSVISLASGMGGGPGGGSGGGDVSVANQPANTKQLMRLMDSLKTLGDENAALLREVQDAEAARMEAKVAREQMKRFKEEYGQRFGTLKAALEKFRKSYPEHGDQETNPVTSSDFVISTSVSDQLQRQEQLIRKLTADLKKEKEESKKKDAALRKYESFYREVKARSAQKAAQRQKETQQRQQQTRPAQAGAPRVPR